MIIQGIDRLRIQQDLDKLSLRGTYRKSKMLLHDTFFQCSYEEEKSSVEDMMLRKSWVIHIVLMSTRIIWPIFGASYWQVSYETSKDMEGLNKEIVASSE